MEELGQIVRWAALEYRPVQISIVSTREVADQDTVQVLRPAQTHVEMLEILSCPAVSSHIPWPVHVQYEPFGLLLWSPNRSALNVLERAYKLWADRQLRARDIQVALLPRSLLQFFGSPTLRVVHCHRRLYWKLPCVFNWF